MRWRQIFALDNTYQMLEAGIREYREWSHCAEGRDVLVAAAAISPTERARLQTAMVPRRLVILGHALFEEPEAAISP